LDDYTLAGYEKYDMLVKRVFHVEDVNVGTSKDGYILRYRGRLLSEDTEAAYDQLAAALSPLDVTPLFRWDGKRHAILLVPGIPKPKPANPRVNAVMFVLTLLSVLWTGAAYGLDQPLPAGIGPAVWALIQRGWPFALSMIAILGTHEFGHYLMGRKHGVQVSLPYFIPLPYPISPFGTLGAFINMKESPKNRKVLLDIGAAGPLAGLIVAIPVLLIGLSMSSVDRLPTAVQSGVAYSMEGSSVLYLLTKFAVFKQMLPSPASYQGMAPLVYWLRYFLTGQPYPLGGLDVMLSSVAWAGWGGLLITGLNLIPAGQLDGGHMLYVLLGRKNAQRVLPFILGGLALLGFVWSGWWLWVLLIFFLGRVYAEPLDQITGLDPRRKALAIIALIVFVLTFTPVPLTYLIGR
jgi:membrane-associated protease RseP (regulator of RpoE activity)